MIGEFLPEGSRKQTAIFLILTLSLTIVLANNGAARALQTSDTSNQQILELGKTITRELTEGQSHSFRVDLKAGEFIHVVIRQLGLNIAATLIAPDKTKLLEADIPRSTQETEWITYSAQQPGTYSIGVRTVDKGAPAGRYEIKIEELRGPGVGDDVRLAAQTAFNDGTRLYNDRNYRGASDKFQEALTLYQKAARRLEEAVMLNCMARARVGMLEYQAAVEPYEEALTIYRELSDLHGEAITLHEIGVAYLSLNHADDAISNFEQALKVRRKVGYRSGEAVTLANLAQSYSSLGRQETAIDYLQQALAIYREVKDRAREGRVLGNIGLVYNLLSRNEKAIEYYEQALVISRELKDRSGEGNALGNLGKAYQDSSKYESAIEYFQMALTIFRELGNRAAEGIALNNIGNSYTYLSQYQKAIEYLEQALTKSREAKDQTNEGRVLNNLGNAYDLLNQYDKAIAYYQQALDLRRAIKDRRGEGLTLGNLAKVYNLQNQYQRAKESLEQALTIKREVKDRAGEGYTLNELGSVYRNLAQTEKAIECYEQARSISIEVKEPVIEADSLWGLGLTQVSLKQYQKASDYYERSLAISRELKSQSGEARALSELMLVWERQNNNALAILYGKEAVNVIQGIRAEIRNLGAESRQSYVRSNEDVYRTLANLLIAQGRLAEAEEVLDLLKEEEFNRVLRRTGPLEPNIGLTKSETEATKVVDQLAQLTSERGSLIAKIANKTATDEDRQRLDSIEAAITEANRKIKIVLLDIAKTGADEKLLTHQSQSMMQSLRKLGKGCVALYTVMTNDKGWVILSTPDFRRAYPIDTADLNHTISDLRLTLKTTDYDPVPLAEKLYRALFLQKNEAGATLAGDLKAYKATTLMWSLDGVLRYVPIGVLHDGKNYLVESYSNIVFTTASLTRLLDSAEGNWRALGLGVSKEHGDFRALAFVPTELRSIIREEGTANSTGVLPGVIRLDEQFTRLALTDGLREGYPVVHIASHFRFDPDREELSYLLLGDGSTLSLQELENSPGIFERVELLTLSACETALGANGKDVEGMAFVAQDLGAKAVIASLWPVSDKGTEVLMREFYHLRESNSQWSKIEALRQAQIALLKGSDETTKQGSPESQPVKVGNITGVSETEGMMKPYQNESRAPFSHPHYWAPFILIGNWK